LGEDLDGQKKKELIEGNYFWWLGESAAAERGRLGLLGNNTIK